MLGIEGDFGKMAGLDNAFGYNVIKMVGNYAESYDKNIGPNTPIGLVVRRATGAAGARAACTNPADSRVRPVGPSNPGGVLSGDGAPLWANGTQENSQQQKWRDRRRPAQKSNGDFAGLNQGQ